MSEEKKCSKCGEVKPVDMFSDTRNQCKACRAKHSKQYYEDNKERMKIYARQHYKDNKEYYLEHAKQYSKDHKDQRKEYSKQDYKNNKEYRKQYNKKYYEDHKDHLKEYNRQHGKEWVKNNPDKTSARGNRRRALQLSAPGDFTATEFRQLCEKHGNKCLCCGEETKLTADHVVPLSKGGSNYIENIQPLCKPCNSSKGNRHNTDYRVGRELCI